MRLTRSRYPPRTRDHPSFEGFAIIRGGLGPTRSPPCGRSALRSARSSRSRRRGACSPRASRGRRARRRQGDEQNSVRPPLEPERTVTVDVHEVYPRSGGDELLDQPRVGRVTGEPSPRSRTRSPSRHTPVTRMPGATRISSGARSSSWRVDEREARAEPRLVEGRALAEDRKAGCRRERRQLVYADDARASRAIRRSPYGRAARRERRAAPRAPRRAPGRVADGAAHAAGARVGDEHRDGQRHVRAVRPVDSRCEALQLALERRHSPTSGTCARRRSSARDVRDFTVRDGSRAPRRSPARRARAGSGGRGCRGRDRRGARLRRAAPRAAPR